jgi:hypothetical protein
MHSSTIIRPVNSLIFVSDRAGGVTPSWQKGRQILWTESCVSVACYPEQDGATEVTLGTADEVNPGFRAQFDGLLKIPNHTVTVQNVVHEIFLAIDVQEQIVRVRVWLNHPRWADKIIVGVA